MNNYKAPTLEEALHRLLEEVVEPVDTETISIYEAVGRITATNYEARLPSPPFDRSPLDGYALSHTAFLTGVSPELPVTLPVCTKIYAGDTVTEPLKTGCAARIMTGGMIPIGADCVVRQEDTNCGEELVTFYHGARANENIRYTGEDIGTGARIATKGERLTPPDLALLASQGYGTVCVHKKPRIGVLSTGSELVNAESALPLPAGKIYDSNGPMVCARLAELGIACEAVVAGDGEAELVQAILTLAEHCDAIITTGGVSVGQRDCLPRVMELLGARVLFHRVAIKPGTPMLAALWQGKLMFALSGNPFAALATLELLTLPVLLKLAGRTAFLPTKVHAPLLEPFAKPSGNRRFLRATITADGVCLPHNHSPGSIGSSRGSNCLVDIPAGSEPLRKGDTVVAVMLLDSFPPPMCPAKSVPIYAVSGLHKTGKTTLLEAAIAHLTKNGCTVGVIKHDGHGFAPDVPGTDSDRLKKAGATAVLVFCDTVFELVQTVQAPSADAMIQRLLRNMEHTPDIILLEGLKSSPYPKLTLTEAASPDELRQAGRTLAERLLRDFIKV